MKLNGLSTALQSPNFRHEPYKIAQTRSSDRSRRPYPTQRGGNSCSPRRSKTMASMESSSSARKVVVLLRATGDAPILKQTKFKMPGTDKFIKVIDYIRRSIQRDTLFVFVNSAFSPGPDETVIDLYNNFGIDGKLVVNYACSMAWG